MDPWLIVRLNELKIKTDDDSGTSTNISHLKYMQIYGTDPALMKGWVNLAHRSYGSTSWSPAARSAARWDIFDLTGNNSVAMYERYGIPSLYGPLPYDQPNASLGVKGHWGELGNVFLHGALAEGWRRTLRQICDKYIRPHLGPGKAGLDEGLLSLFLRHARLYGEYIYVNKIQCIMPVRPRLQIGLPRGADRRRGLRRVISDCHFAVQLNHFVPGFLSHSVAVFRK
jgi:hypothetical protein